MNKWSCRKCDGLGMYPHPEKPLTQQVCDCPSGDAKRRLIKQTPEERRREQRESKRRKKKQDDEPLPDWVKE
jgi:hypothetical protein